jgi:hypothetical protein
MILAIASAIARQSAALQAERRCIALFSLRRRQH